METKASSVHEMTERERRLARRLGHLPREVPASTGEPRPGGRELKKLPVDKKLWTVEEVLRDLRRKEIAERRRQRALRDLQRLQEEEGADDDAAGVRKETGEEVKGAPGGPGGETARTEGGSRHVDQRKGAEAESVDADMEDGGAVVAPQLTLDGSGNIVVNEESLMLTTGQEIEAGTGPTIEVDPNAYINNATYMKKEKSVSWSPEETSLFYRALSQFGTDFGLMERVIPNRSRRQIKLKFNREERLNPMRVSYAFRTRAPIDREVLDEVERRLLGRAGPRGGPSNEDSATTEVHGVDTPLPTTPMTATPPLTQVSQPEAHQMTPADDHGTPSSADAGAMALDGTQTTVMHSPH